VFRPAPPATVFIANKGRYRRRLWHSAVEEAPTSNIAKSVTVAHRRDFSGGEILQERLFAKENANRTPKPANAPPADAANGIGRVCATSGPRRSPTCWTTACSWRSAAPATELFTGKLEAHDNRAILTAPDSTATSVEGAPTPPATPRTTMPRQAVTAAGMGQLAAR